MIYRHKIDSLTDLEKGVLLYALNEVFKGQIKVDIDTVTAYKKDAMYAKLRAAKNSIKPEHIDIYCDMCSKLGLDL
tara:strand:+ start:630 stop:857 length:228 start_codon:yes stop_codon:yes gene_type:complete